VNSLHGLLNCEIGALDCPVITRVHLFCIALVYVMFSGVSGQCSHTIDWQALVSLLY